MNEFNWRVRYINRLIIRGISNEFAKETYEAGIDDHDFLSDPEDAADEELSYWSDNEL